jgi:RecJ-like exonuclease
MSDPRDEHDNPEIDCKECEGTGYVNDLEVCMACCGTGKRPMTEDELETFKNNQKYGHHEKL